MMKKTVLVATIVVTLAAALVLITPPFILPEPVYEFVYGWRYPKQWNAGDAEVVDNGPGTANGRFTIRIELPPQTGDFRREISLTNLPREEFTMGLLVPLEVAGSWKREWDTLSETTLVITAIDESGSIIASHDGPMGGEWTWSGPYGDKAFVYCLETQFEADPTQQYTVSLFITAAETLPTNTAVHFQAGGWK